VQNDVVDMKSNMVKPGTSTWSLWLALGLGVLGTLGAVLSIRSKLMLIFLALSALMALVGLVQFSLWSTLRRSSL
jgi:hypothetical protein